jgi:hypothetical protein
VLSLAQQMPDNLRLGFFYPQPTGARKGSLQLIFVRHEQQFSISPSRPSPFIARGGSSAVISLSAEVFSTASGKFVTDIEMGLVVYAVTSVPFNTVLSRPRVSKKTGAAGR